MINFASIGTNFIVHNILDAVNEIDGFNYYAAYSRTIEKAKDMVDKYGGEKSYDDLKSMLNDEKIDVIYIASPNSLHFEQAKKSLLKGKNVICEKPFFTNRKELYELMKIADEKKLFLFEAISIKYLESLKILKDLSRKIGKISTVMINYSQYSSRFDKYRKGEVSNIFKSKFSAGALADLGIYNLHLIYELFGKGKDYAYFGDINKYGVDISGIGLIKYDGFNVSFTNAKDSYSKNYIIIQGEDGYIKVNGNIQEASQIEFSKNSDTKIIDIKKEKSIYTREFEIFKNMYENKDYNKCRKFLEESSNVLEMFENLKQKGNIKDFYNYIEPTS